MPAWNVHFRRHGTRKITSPPWDLTVDLCMVLRGGHSLLSEKPIENTVLLALRRMPEWNVHFRRHGTQLGGRCYLAHKQTSPNGTVLTVDLCIVPRGRHFLMSGNPFSKLLLALRRMPAWNVHFRRQAARGTQLELLSEFIIAHGHTARRPDRCLSARTRGGYA